MSLAQCKYSTDIQYNDDDCSDIVINDLRQIQVISLYPNSVVEQSWDLGTERFEFEKYHLLAASF